MCTLRIPVLLLALGGLSVASAQADVLDVVLNDANAADNFLYNIQPTTNFANSGLFYYDQRGTGNEAARPLIKFGLPTLPSGSTITSVSLRLMIKQYTCIDVNNANAIVPYNYSVHQMLADWDESTSSWNERSAGNPWATPGLGSGTDYGAVAAATQLISTPNANSFINVPVQWDITALYLSWLANPATNFGVYVRGQTGVANLTTTQGDTTDGYCNWYNTEFGDDARRPHLLVNYVPAPGTAFFLAIGGMAASRRRRG